MGLGTSAIELLTGKYRYHVIIILGVLLILGFGLLALLFMLLTVFFAFG